MFKINPVLKTSDDKILYRSEIRTRPDGTSYVQCIICDDYMTEILTEDQKLIAAQLKAWNTTE